MSNFPGTGASPPINPVDDAAFAPAAFFARAAARLAHDPPVAATGAAGDDLLNPGFLDHQADYREAAVLIPVVARDPQATMLLTQRTAHLPSHAGQIAFPGGKIDPGDTGPAAAALREAGEEIGLDPSLVQIVGYLEPYLTRTGYRIVPVLGRVDPALRLTINPEEVVEAFEVPLAFLIDRANHVREARTVKGGATREFWAIPYQDYYIWGATAGMLVNLSEILGD
jgi:8-oxo-dGTP pyrophosphatase MutT (NUDIX family)